MKYLITGGAGFIGFNLVKKLAKSKNNYIFIIDDLSLSERKKITQSFKDSISGYTYFEK